MRVRQARWPGIGRRTFGKISLRDPDQNSPCQMGIAYLGVHRCVILSITLPRKLIQQVKHIAENCNWVKEIGTLAIALHNSK